MSVHEDLGRALFDALNSGKSIPPLRDEIDNDVDAAYRVQESFVALRMARGETVVGKKIGLTSFAVQEQLGVDQPDYGILFHTMDVSVDKTLDATHLIMPKAEGELAFILKANLDQPEITREDLVQAIGSVVAAIEVVDSRVANWNIRISDTIADNASGSHFILGPASRTLDEITPAEVQMTLFKNGEAVSDGSGAACMDDPLNAALWLAQKMQAQGSPLRAGEVLLSGALGPMVPIAPGDELRLEISGFDPVELSVK
jgi:2-keto-4-pentenoate hydratase